MDDLTKLTKAELIAELLAEREAGHAWADDAEKVGADLIEVQQKLSAMAGDFKYENDRYNEVRGLLDRLIDQINFIQSQVDGYERHDNSENMKLDQQVHEVHSILINFAVRLARAGVYKDEHVDLKDRLIPMPKGDTDA